MVSVTHTQGSALGTLGFFEKTMLALMSENEPAPIMIKPANCWQMMQDDTAVLLVDVRSDMEFLMIGHPVGALNAAWIDHPEWTVSPNFVSAVRKLMLGRVSGHAQNTVSLVLICRSGNRSVDAANALLAEGVENVHVVEGGFEGPLDENRHRNTVAGWRHAGLPWEQC